MTAQTQSQKLNRMIAVQQMKAKGEITRDELLQLMHNSGCFTPAEIQILGKVDWQTLTESQIIDELDKIFNT